jgi:hypothetical protein
MARGGRPRKPGPRQSNGRLMVGDLAVAEAGELGSGTGLAPEHRLLLGALPHFNLITESALPKMLSREHRGEQTDELEYMLDLLTAHSASRYNTLAAARQRTATKLRAAIHLVREAQRAFIEDSPSGTNWPHILGVAGPQEIADQLAQRAADMEPPTPPQRRVGNPGSPEFRAFVGIAAIIYERQTGRRATPRSTRFVRWIEPYLTLPEAAHAHGWPRTDQQRAERIRAVLAKLPIAPRRGTGPGVITNAPNKTR